MTGRPHVAERTRGLATEHQVGRQYVGPGGSQRRLERVGTHPGIGVDVGEPLRGRAVGQAFDVAERMHPGELLDGGARGLVVLQQVVQAARVQRVLDGVQARRSFRMLVAHPVQVAVRVGHEGDGHGRLHLR